LHPSAPRFLERSPAALTLAIRAALLLNRRYRHAALVAPNDVRHRICVTGERTNARLELRHNWPNKRPRRSRGGRILRSGRRRLRSAARYACSTQSATEKRTPIHDAEPLTRAMPSGFLTHGQRLGIQRSYGRSTTIRYTAVIPSYSCRDRCIAEDARPVPLTALSKCSRRFRQKPSDSRPTRVNPRANP